MMFLKWIVRATISTIILVIILLIFLLTPYGFQSSLYFAEKIFPGTIHYKELNGLFTGPIEIKELDYHYENTHIHIHHIDFNWSPLSLFKGALKIDEFNASGIKIFLPKNEQNQSSEKFSFLKFNTLKSIKIKTHPINFPLSININHANISDITYGYSPKNIVFHVKKITLNGTIQKKIIQLTAKVELTSPENTFFRVNAFGNLENYELKLFLNTPDSHLSVYIAGNQNSAQITIPKNPLFNGRVNGSINITWYPTIAWNAALNVTSLDLKKIAAQLPEALSGHIISKGTVINNNPNFDFTAVLTDGQMNINTHIQHQHQWNMTWAFNIPNLNNLLPSAYGSLQSKGSLTGSLEQPEVSGTLNGINVGYGNTATDSISANWKLFFDKSIVSTFHIATSNIAYKETVLSSLQLNGTGNLKTRTLSVNVTNPTHNVEIDMTGHYDTDHWQGKITNFLTHHNTLGTWKLKTPSNFTFSTAYFTLNPVCLESTLGASLCAHAQWKKYKPWDFVVHSTKIHLNPQFTSDLSFDATASGTGEKVNAANLALNLSPGTLSYTIKKQIIDTKIRASSITAVIDKKGLHGNLNFNVSEKDNAVGTIHIPDFNDTSIPFKNKKIAGDVNVLMHDFRFVTLLQSILKISFGTMDGHFNISGTLSDPQLQGKATVDAPYFEYTPMEVVVQNIQGTLTASNKKLTYQATGYAYNKVPVIMTGETNFSGPQIVTKFNVNTTDAELIQNNQFNVFATTSLDFLINPAEISINGNVLIPQAVIQPVNLSTTLTLPKHQIVYIGLPNSMQPRPKHKVLLNILIRLGDKIAFNAYGISGGLGGEIHIAMSPDQTAIGNGQIHINEATFQAYGQYLNIEKGSSISYIKSPLANPYINARAYKSIKATSEVLGQQLSQEAIQVGVQIQGTLKTMKFTLYSQPPLSQADILSYLVLGYASSNATPASITALLDAASAMSDSSGGLNQSVSFTDKIKHILGIEQLGIRNESIIDAVGNPIDTQSSFVVGERISPKIYLEYSRGMLIPNNILKANYEINKNWTLQTMTGSGDYAGTGADILYSISSD